MSCALIGPGLVGSLLGAAGDLPGVIARQPGPVRRRVRLPNGRVVDWRPAPATGPGQALVCTRLPDTPWRRLPADTLLAQNGLDQRRPTAACFFAVDQGADGLVRTTGPTPRIVVPHLGRTWRPLLDAWREAGIVVEEVADTRAARFEKAILNATVGPLCAADGRSMAAAWVAERDLVLEATAEGLRLGHAAGLRLREDLVAEAIAFFDAVGDHRPSALDDDREIPAILGPLLQLGRDHHVPTPALTAIAERLRLIEPLQA